MGAVSHVQLSTASRFPEEEPGNEVEGADSGGHEERPEHQFRARRVLAGVLADEAAEPEPGALGHRFALEFLDGVAAGVRGLVGHAHLTASGRPSFPHPHPSGR